jgi:hypothetical protein
MWMWIVDCGLWLTVGRCAHLGYPEFALRLYADPATCEFSPSVLRPETTRLLKSC